MEIVTILLFAVAVAIAWEVWDIYAHRRKYDRRHRRRQDFSDEPVHVTRYGYLTRDKKGHLILSTDGEYWNKVRFTCSECGHEEGDSCQIKRVDLCQVCHRGALTVVVL